MIYKWIDGSIIIADVMDRFNIETTDWYPRVGYWVENALADIKVLPTAELKCKRVNAKGYMVELPTVAKSIVAVEMEGVRLHNSTQIKQGGKDFHSVPYTLLHNNYLRLEADHPRYSDIEVTIYYKGFDTTFNKKLHIEIPLIPDKAIVIEAISYYVFKNILSRGYIHPVYNLSGNDPHLSVNIIYKGYDGKGGLRKRAMIEAKTMNLDTREKASGMIRTFLDPDHYDNSDFDGNINTRN